MPVSGNNYFSWFDVFIEKYHRECERVLKNQRTVDRGDVEVISKSCFSSTKISTGIFRIFLSVVGQKKSFCTCWEFRSVNILSSVGPVEK